MAIFFLKLVILLSYIFIVSKEDAEILNGGNFIYSHITRLISRSLLVIALSLGEDFSYNLIVFSLTFMVFFDQVLNLLRINISLFYLGTTSNWDKFFSKRLLLYVIIKILGLLLVIYLTLKHKELHGILCFN